MDRNKLLSALGKSEYARALREFLRDELQKIDTVEGATSMDIVNGRRIAVDIVNRLFRFLESEPTKEGKKERYD